MLFSFLRPALFICLLALTGAALGASLFSAGLIAKSEQQVRRATSAYMVRVISPATDDAVTRAATTLAAAPDVRGARPMDAARAAQLLSRWGGRPFNAKDLPPLRLIEVRTTGATDALTMSASFMERLRTAGIAAEVYDSGPLPREGLAPARLAFASGLTITAALTLALAFALAAAGGGGGARATSPVDHGATRRATLAAFGRAGAEAAFLAAAVAVCLALIIAPGMRAAAGDAISFGSMIASLSPWDVLISLGAPLAAGAAGLIGARIGAASGYDAADRLG
jgi:hypothetical protein